MSEAVFSIRPRDPILVRDGRPFSPDQNLAQSLPWPLPSTLAGAMRTHIGNARGFTWTKGDSEKALGFQVAGPLMLVSRDGADWTPFFPAPLDAVPLREGGLMRLRPMKRLPDGAGCSPDKGLLPFKADDGNKRQDGYDFWSMQDTAKWLSDPATTDLPATYTGSLPRESRTHVKIGPSGTNEDGMLFSTVSICFKDVPAKDAGASPDADRQPMVSALCRVRADIIPETAAPAFLQLGGEKRVSAVVSAQSFWPTLPPDLAKTLVGKHLLKLQLVTPAIFRDGWKPGWLDGGIQGSPPSLKGLKLKLIAAAVGRRIPVSGWDLAKGHCKAARFAVPAGSVYFFEIEEGSLSEALAQGLWLCSICDVDKDDREGFGLAIPGIWDYAP